MLMAYGELEFDVARLLGYVVEGGNDIAGRIFFRVNGESARLDVADAILRPFFERLKLGGQWGNALGALRYCKNVRNQYAHCNWHTQNGGLVFINMDADVDSPEGILTVHLYPTDLALLQKQTEYFQYTIGSLFYLNCKCRLRSGEEAPDFPIPKSILQPPLHNRPKIPPATPEADMAPKAPRE
jgi:hypothetical protein